MQGKKIGQIIWYLGSALLVMWAAGLPAALLTEALHLEHSVIGTLVTAAITIPVVWQMYGRDKERYEQAGELWWKQRADARGADYARTAVCGISACLLLNLLMLLARVSERDTSYREMAGALNREPYLLQLLVLGVLAPVAEELVYRGMIYRRMRESLSFGQAAVFVSLLFGAGHGYLSQCMYAFLLGIFLAYVYEKFRTVKAPVLLHILMNLAVLLLNRTDGFAWICKNGLRAMGFAAAFALLAAYTFGKIRKIRTVLR